MKIVCVLAALLVLSGCAAQETFETVSDWYYEPAISMGVIRMTLPQDAAVVTSHSDAGSIYICDGYTLSVQTLDGGDLDRSLRTVSGFSSDQLQLLQTQRQGGKRYDFVWAAAGEGGDQMCRGALIDDGTYHYTLCVMSDAAESGEFQETWNALFSSFGLENEETPAES